MDNYYEKLKANFPTFNSTLQLDMRQQKSLESLISFTEGALSSYRSKVQEADALYSQYNEKIRDQKRSEALSTAKTKSKGSIEAEFEKIENRAATAKSVLYSAIHQGKPQDSTEALLRFLQQQEIRNALEKMPLSKRVEALQRSCQDGLGEVLWAVESQPITSELVPKDVMERSTETLGSKMAPSQAEMVELAERDLESATAIKGLAQVTMGHLEDGSLS